MGKQHVQGYSWAMNSFFFHYDVLMSQKIWIYVLSGMYSLSFVEFPESLEADCFF